MATHTTFCRICESLCGLNITTVDGRVTGIRPDAENIATAGFACQKGLRQHHLYASPDRLLKPRRKTAAGWEDTSWDTALGDIGGKLRSIRATHGGDAIAMYVGTAAGFGVLHPVFAQGFMDAMGSRSMFASATQDCANKFAVAERMYGFPFTQPFPDLLHTQCLIIVGANPMVSKWSFLQVPNPRKHIDAIKARGGRVIVVDPRRTETAKATGEHLFIKPGTDVFFYLSFLHVVLERDGVDHETVRKFMDGFDALNDLSKDWSPEHTASITGIDATVLRDLVSTYLKADGAALYSSTGVNMNEGGTPSFWLQEVINAITGNLDRQGGTLVGKGIFDFPKFGRKYGVLLKQDRSRIGGFRKTNDAFPGGILADEILTDGPGRIRALIVTGGNPLMMMAESDKLRRAFGELELLVTLDILPTETASAGHYMLPCTSPLERPDLPFIFPLALGMQTRPYLQATEAVLPIPGEARDEATIYVDLARASGAALFGSRIVQWLFERTRKRRGTDTYASVAQRGLLNLLLRLTGQGRFADLVGHGRARPPNEGGSFLGQRVYSKPDGTGRIQLAPSELVDIIHKLKTPDADDGFSYRLITRRQIQTHNSWTHNYDDFLDRLGGRNHLYMHSDDAQRENFTEGTLVDVSTDSGTIRLPVSLCDDLLKGVVAVPHGWGHQASGQRIAAASPGVNVNIIARSGVDAIDPLSGMSRLTAIPVRLAMAADNETANNWSGRQTGT